MRHAAVLHCTACTAPLHNNRRYVAVRLLTGDTLYFSVDTKCKLSDLFVQVTERMCYQGMLDPHLFGLAVVIDGEYVFVEGDYKVSKYAPKSWKSASDNGLDGCGRPVLQFSLRVKFYVDCHRLLRDHVTQHHYYLQLRENVLVQRQTCRQESYFLLAAWALQADLGNYQLGSSRAYFQPAEYFPQSVIAAVGVDYILDSVPALHRDNVNMTKPDAELAYIREASAVEAPHNLHIYRLKRRKSDLTGSVLLGVCPNGIELYQEERNSARKLLASFVWTNINNLSFEKKKFEIRALTQKFTFYTSNDDKSKHLLSLCREVHMFTRSLKERLAQLRQGSDEEGRSLAGSVRRPSGRHSDWEFVTKPGDSADQRVSVISSTSSNTTSGIVSDRTGHSLDDSDDDIRTELRLRRPPLTESLESGMESLAQSLSQLDNASLRSSQRSPAVQETLTAATCGRSVEPDLPSIVHSANCASSGSGDTAPLDVTRTGSAHSSSSQHSASTVRSRYSLAKLSRKAVDIDLTDHPPPPAEADHLPQKGMFAAHTNCCSTCVEDDTVSLCSEGCDTCSTCRSRARRAGSEQRTFPSDGDGDRTSLNSSSTVHVQAGSSPCPLHVPAGGLQHLSQSSVTSGASVASTLDSTRAVGDDNGSLVTPSDLDQASVYNLSDDFSFQPDADADYVLFCESRPVQDCSGDVCKETDVDSVSVGSAASSSGCRTLDFSVHSAHTSVGSVVTTPGSFPRRTTVSHTLDTDSDYVQVPYDERGQFRIPEAVPMSTVTTVTPVSLAQSCQTGEEPGPPTPRPSQRVVLVPSGSGPPSSEAPARFITARPQITVFRALSRPAVTQTPRFARPTVVARRTRASAAGHQAARGVPQLTAGIFSGSPKESDGYAIKPKALYPTSGAVVSLPCGSGLGTSPISDLPVIQNNNYLDLRASSVSGQAVPPRARPSLSVAAAAAARGSLTHVDESGQRQMDQFRFQLLTDADYVIYPLKDPAVSRQEYADVRNCGRQPLPPPPPYRSSQLCLSTPNLAAVSRSGSDACRAGRPAPLCLSLGLSQPDVSLAAPAGHQMYRPDLPRPGVLRARSDNNLFSPGAVREMSLAAAPPPPPPYWQAQSQLQKKDLSGLHLEEHVPLKHPVHRHQSVLNLGSQLRHPSAIGGEHQRHHLSMMDLTRHQHQSPASSESQQLHTPLSDPRHPHQHSVMNPGHQRLQQSMLNLGGQQPLEQQQQQQQCSLSGLQYQQRPRSMVNLSGPQCGQSLTVSPHRQQPGTEDSRQLHQPQTSAAGQQRLRSQRQQEQLRLQQQREQQERQQQQRLKASQQAMLRHQQLVCERLGRGSQPRSRGQPGDDQRVLTSSEEHQRVLTSAVDRRQSSEEQLDLEGLRAAAQGLDLPLISALCNDRVLTDSRARRQRTSSSSQPTPSQLTTAQPHSAKNRLLGVPILVPQRPREALLTAGGAGGWQAAPTHKHHTQQTTNVAGPVVMSRTSNR